MQKPIPWGLSASAPAEGENLHPPACMKFQLIFADTQILNILHHFGRCVRQIVAANPFQDDVFP
jgi:hypothetical protein